MKLVVKSPVWDDLRQIGLRIKKDDPKAALRFFNAARTTFKLIAQQPGIGRLRSFSQPGIRSITIRRFRKYIVFYLPTSAEVQILAVLHGARDLEPLIEERL